MLQYMYLGVIMHNLGKEMTACGGLEGTCFGRLQHIFLKGVPLCKAGGRGHAAASCWWAAAAAWP